LAEPGGLGGAKKEIAKIPEHPIDTFRAGRCLRCWPLDYEERFDSHD